MSLFKNIPADALLINKNDPDELLGSCSKHSFFLDEYEWPTAEHYYQAMKFEDKPYRDRIRLCQTTEEARKLGNRWLKRKRADFKQVRTILMTRAMYTKCKTYPKIAQTLIDTGDVQIAENSFSGYYWGCGRDGRGDNRFGKLLMNVRSKLLEERDQNTA